MARPKKLPTGMMKRGNIYYACFRHGGKLHRERLSADFDAAKAILNDLRSRADKQDHGLVDNNYPWNDLKAEFLRWARQSVRNPRDYERDLKRFESYGRVASIRQVDQAYVLGYREWRLSQIKGSVAGLEWKAATGKRVSPRTVNREVATLQNMLNKGVETKKIGSNPIAGIKPLEQGDPRKQRRALTTEEVLAIFDKAPEYLKPVLRLYASTGVRRNELVELLFSDIDFDRRSLTVRASIAKGKREREITLGDETLAMLAGLRDKAKQRQPVEGNAAAFSRDHVFVTADNTPLRNNLLRAFYAVCKRAGIAGAEQGGSVDIHALRVTFATASLDGLANPRAVQAILGHSTLEMTMKVYAKATEKAKRNAVSALPWEKCSTPDHVLAMPDVPKSAHSSFKATQAHAG